jgi:CBS domain-containing protein
MVTKPITVKPDDSVRTCMELMTQHRIRHLPVLEQDKLVGLVSIGDVVKAIMTQQAFMIEQLEHYISGQA